MEQLVRKVLGYLFPIALTVRRMYRQVRRPINIGVRVIVADNGQVLLVRHHGQTAWLLPGGLAGRGESLRAAAIREVREESGCTVVAERLLGMYSSLHEGMTLHTAVFVCRPLTASQAQLNIETADARFWPIDALPPTEGQVPERLAEYLAGAQGLDRGFEA
jgi:ADP-ribose pyrophosphatase YjhB (NUDIX family)